MYATSDNGLSWSEQQELVAYGGAAGDEFGFSVFIYGTMIVVGVRFDDNEKGTSAGDKTHCMTLTMFDGSYYG